MFCFNYLALSSSNCGSDHWRATENSSSVVSETEGRTRRLDTAADADGCQGCWIGSSDAVVVGVMLMLLLLVLLMLLLVVVVVKVVAAVHGLLGWSWRSVGVSLEANVHPGRWHHGGGMKAGEHHAVRLKLEKKFKQSLRRQKSSGNQTKS